MQFFPFSFIDCSVFYLSVIQLYPNYSNNHSLISSTKYCAVRERLCFGDGSFPVFEVTNGTDPHQADRVPEISAKRSRPYFRSGTDNPD